MQQFQLDALRKATALNPAVTLPRFGKPTVRMPCGKCQPIVPSLTHVKLFWGTSHCLPGKQHYRHCTPHTLRHAIKLRCSFCAYNSVEWVAEGARVIAESEQWVMWQLGQLGLDQHFCWQAQPRWWQGSVDFMMLSQKVIIQADGSSHTKDMRGEEPGKQLDDDMRFCVAAVSKGVSVVRVHEQQLSGTQRPVYLAAAVQHAAADTCIVLSSGYNTVTFYHNHKPCTYAQLLAEQLSGFRVLHDACSNIVICKK